MTSVITGDIINSRKLKSPSQWLIPLKKLLNEQGMSPSTWEIFRGDSFQVEVKQPEEALLYAIRIKATIKCLKGVDVRMSIGVGKKDYKALKITESNGEVFIHSGEKIEDLKKQKQNLAIKTPWSGFDKEMNQYLRLALIAMDNWSQGAAEVVKVFLENPDKTQKEIAHILDKRQSSISERKTRAHFDEIMEVETAYRTTIEKLIKG